MPTQAQLAKIHIAVKELKISDINYRQILAGFTINNQPVTSSKQLNEYQADKLLEIFVKLGWKAKSNKKAFSHGRSKKFDELANRDSSFASPAQLRMIYYLWMDRSSNKTEDSLNQFIKRIVGVEKLEWLLKWHIQKIKLAIENLR